MAEINTPVLRNVFKRTNLDEQILSLRKNSIFARKSSINARKVLTRKTLVSAKAQQTEKRINFLFETRNRRRRREELLEANSTKSGYVSGTVKNALDRGKGFLGKIMDSLGFLLLGWLVNQLPRILVFIDTLKFRITNIIDAGKSMIKNIGNIINGITGVVSQATQNIMNFDFQDFNDPNGKFQTKIKELDKNIQSLGNDFEDAKINVLKITTPPTEEERRQKEEQPGQATRPTPTPTPTPTPAPTPRPTPRPTPGPSGKGPGPSNLSPKQAFDYIYGLAVKVGGAKFPELVAAHSMQETGYLSNPNSIYFSSGKTNAFGQTIYKHEVGTNGIIDRIKWAGRWWAVYDSIESSVKHHIKLWHSTHRFKDNYNGHDSMTEAMATIIPKYSPDADKENIRLGFSEDAYGKGMFEHLRLGGFDPKGGPGQRGNVQTVSPTPQAPQRRFGDRAVLNGKPVRWGGKNYGWQSLESFDKLSRSRQQTAPQGPFSGPVRGPVRQGGLNLIPQRLSDPGGFIQGGSGSRLGPDGTTETHYATHFHIDGPRNLTNKQRKEIREVAFHAIKAMFARGSWVHLGSSRQDLSKGISDSTLRRALLIEQNAHASRSSPAIDIQENNPNIQRTFPSQPGSRTTFPFAVGKVYMRGGYGREAMILGTDQISVSHGAPGSVESPVSVRQRNNRASIQQSTARGMTIAMVPVPVETKVYVPTPSSGGTNFAGSNRVDPLNSIRNINSMYT